MRIIHPRSMMPWIIIAVIVASGWGPVQHVALAQSPPEVTNVEDMLALESSVRIIAPDENGPGSQVAGNIAGQGQTSPQGIAADAGLVAGRFLGGQVTPISGTVRLQGRTNFGGTGIFLSIEPCSSSLSGVEPNAVTDTQGRFTIIPSPNLVYHCLKTVQHGYLTGQKGSPQGEVGAITLPGGDVVEDGVINILDLAFMAIHYRSSEPAADVNADGDVDIFDLTIAASNYNQRGPVINWE